MRAVVVYDSSQGNTRLIATAVGRGLRDYGQVVVVAADQASGVPVDAADLVVVGAAACVPGRRRRSAEAGTDLGGREATEPTEPARARAAARRGELRRWVDSLGRVPAPAAAFDTRLEGPALRARRASRRMCRSLRHHGLRLVVAPESFLVARDDHLERGEERRAQEWGAYLAEIVARSEGPFTRS